MLHAGGVDVDVLREAMALIAGTPVETEASGNVTLQTAREIASTGVSFISCGALTHSVAALDISLRIHEQHATAAAGEAAAANGTGEVSAL